MTVETVQTRAALHERQFVTFELGQLLLGVDIGQVREINSHLEITPVPGAAEHIRGVINLRGDVVTLVDLRRQLEMPPAKITSHSRNVVINAAGDVERIGLLVDRIADVVNVPESEIESPPANIAGVEGRFFSGVFKMSSQLLTLLNIDEICLTDDESGEPGSSRNSA